MEPQADRPGGSSPYVTPQVVYQTPPPPPPPPRGRSVVGRLFGLISLLVFVGGLVFFGLVVFPLLKAIGDTGGAKPGEKYHSLARAGKNKVAVIRIEGLIYETEGYVKGQIDAVRDDPNVKAVVLRVDSPGGTVSASDYIYHRLTKTLEEREIPIVVSMGGLAASGGYYVSMAVGDQEDSIFAEPTTWTGSIGVVIPHYNASELAARWGVEEDSIKSHPLKQMGSPLKKMTEKEQAIFQSLVDEMFVQFKDIVKAGRPAFRDVPDDDPKHGLDLYATGQVFTTKQAIEAGLVDRSGFLEDAIDRAVELAGLDVADTKAIEYRRTPTLSEALFGSTSIKATSEVQLLLEMSTPRAYMICTWLPPMIASGR